MGLLVMAFHLLNLGFQFVFCGYRHHLAYVISIHLLAFIKDESGGPDVAVQNNRHAEV